MNSNILSIMFIFSSTFFYVVDSSMLNIAGHNIFDENEEIESLADSKCPNGAKLGKVCKMSAQCGKRGFCRLTTEPGKGKGKKTKHCCEHSADVNNLVCFKNKNGKDVKPSKIACNTNSKKGLCERSKIKGFCKRFQVAGQSHKKNYVGLCCPPMPKNHKKQN